MNDSNKLLTPTSASTTTTNNNTNSVNANSSDNNTRSKLMPSSNDEERKESEKYGNAAKTRCKRRNPCFQLRTVEERNYTYRWRFDVSLIERSKTLQK